MKIDNRQFNRGRPKLPAEQKKEFMGFNLPLSVRTKIRIFSAAYGSQANFISEAVEAFQPNKPPAAIEPAKPTKPKFFAT